MTTVDQQKRMFWDAERNSARLNEAFLEMVNHPTNPLTRSDLAALIKKRPETYGRFSHWLNKLPDAEQHDMHVIRFRSYQRAWMMREYRKAGEHF